VVKVPEPVAVAVRPQERPTLVFFFSPRSGRCRRVEGFIAQVLQHRQNHDTFLLRRVSVEDEPLLAEKFGIREVPTLCVIEHNKLLKSIVAPSGCHEIELELSAWLR
jgi:thioredoxin-like negative regulator of GroEL